MLCSPDAIINGGWWHDPRILAATGRGVEKEEKRAYQGFWNERVLELVQLSINQKDALTILLTGRGEQRFADLIKRICKSRNIDFDMIVLKPVVTPTSQHFTSTMHFKQLFLENLMETYCHAEEIRIYEDRPKHVRGFRDFLRDYISRQHGIGGVLPSRKPPVAEVIHVAELASTLDPVVEVSEVMKMIQEHNRAVSKKAFPPGGGRRRERLAVKKTVFFTSYMIGRADSEKLKQLANIPESMPRNEIKYQANSILICPRPCPPSILEKVGGMGSKMKWKVTGTACFENSIWAACVRPVPDTAKFHTDNPCPLVVLALRRNARPVDAGKIQNWQPVPSDKAYVFETTVKEKTILRIEAEDRGEDEYESLFANKGAKRKHHANNDDDYPPRGPKDPHYGGRNIHNTRGYHGRRGNNYNQGGRDNFQGGSNRGFRGGRGGGSNRGRGGRGGGGFNYRSLDDVDRNQQASGGPMDYDDYQAPPPQTTVPPPSIPPQPFQQFAGYQMPGGRPPMGGGDGQGGNGGWNAGGGDLGNYY